MRTTTLTRTGPSFIRKDVPGRQMKVQCFAAMTLTFWARHKASKTSVVSGLDVGFSVLEGAFCAQGTHNTERGLCTNALAKRHGRFYVQIYSDNFIPQLPNTAHSCSRDALTTAWFTSERPVNLISVLKISTLLGEQEHCFSQ